MATRYPATGRTAGEEGSGTFEGRYLSFVESDLVHPTHTDGFVDKGDPVNAGSIVGVALGSATASTDVIAVETEGIWYLNVVASDDAGTSAVNVGDDICIAAGVLSKKASGTHFGKALGTLAGSATAALVAVWCHKGRIPSSMSGLKFQVSMPFGAAEVTAGTGFFIAPAACRVISAYEAHGTVAGQAGTLQIEKCNTGEAKAAGDALLATTFDLTSTANTPVLKAAVADGKEYLVAGDKLRLSLASGAATSLADAAITVLMQWV
jgi:hypothetical protein